MSIENLDHAAVDWINDGPDRGPQRGLDRALAAARSVNQRPGWSFPTRWLPEAAVDVRTHVPQLAGTGVALLLLLLALVAMAVSFGARPPLIRSLLGEAGDRLIAYETEAGVFVSLADGSGRRQIATDVPNARAPVFDPGGDYVAVLGSSAPDAGDWQVHVTKADGSEASTSVSGELNVLPPGEDYLAWSPDGYELAFVAAGDGGSRRIYTVYRDGGDLRPLTEAGVDADLPSWSSDVDPGVDWIAYRVVDEAAQRQQLITVRSDGAATIQIATVIGPDSSLSRADWAPRPADWGVSSQGLPHPVAYAFNAGFGTETIALIDLGFGHTAPIWSQGLRGGRLATVPWSPDGRYLAFLSEDEGVIVAEYDGSSPDYDGELRHLGPLADCWIEWAPDGTALYGGTPDGCSGTVIIPLEDPAQAAELPGADSGWASWQPLEP